MPPLLSPEQIAQQAAELLRQGKLVAIPTETVYGLAADATNEDAVQKIFEVKGRPSNNPLILHVDSLETALPYIDLGSHPESDRMVSMLRKLSAQFWPGPLSVVVKRGSGIADSVCAGGDTIALRVPNHPLTLSILKHVGRPVAAPSANPSSYISPTSAHHVAISLGPLVDLIVDGGPCAVGVESTVVNLLSNPIAILRPGLISAEEIEQTLGCPVENFTPSREGPQAEEVLLSPGMLTKHYSPRTPVVLLPNITDFTALPEKVGAILFNERPLPMTCNHRIVLSETGDLLKISAGLFAALRELDQLDLDLIITDTCEPKGFGLAIMDRLLRASATS